MTTNSTEERIAQIRERNLKRAARHAIAGHELMETVSDIDFLLSLLDRSAAGDTASDASEQDH